MNDECEYFPLLCQSPGEICLMEWKFSDNEIIFVLFVTVTVLFVSYSNHFSSDSLLWIKLLIQKYFNFFSAISKLNGYHGSTT